MNLLDQVKAAAAANALKDQTVDTGGYERVVEPEGRALARLVSYVEIGKRPQKPYLGKAKPDAFEVRLGFELVGAKRTRTITVDEVEQSFQPVIHTKTTIKGGDKAGFTKLLNKMAYSRDINHMALMLGEGFIITIKHGHSEVDKDGKPTKNSKTYANIKDSEGNWLIAAPLVLVDPNDPECNEYKPVAVPPATTPLQLLLWDAPTKEQWDSIFIDGTTQRKNDKGETVTVSKNWIQEDIVKNAKDFEGSALQALMLEMAGGLELDGGKAAAQSPASGDDLDGDLPSVPATAAASDEPVRAGSPSAEDGEVGSSEAAGDPLAAMGFDDL